MARIMMKKAHNESISEAFEGFMLSAQSRGLTNKTLKSAVSSFLLVAEVADVIIEILEADLFGGMVFL